MYFLGPDYVWILQAQVMKGKPAEIRMDGVHRPSLTSLPVMFFGTLEIAWISPTETSKWQDGIKAKFHTKPKGRKTFDNALQQVCLAVHPEKTIALSLSNQASILCRSCLLNLSMSSRESGAQQECHSLIRSRNFAGGRLRSIEEVASELVVQKASAAQSSRRSSH